MKNQDWPFFSIIIPTYERAAQLRLCLQAISRLEYPTEKFEVLVVDDGSAHPPNEIVAQFRGQFDVKLFQQSKKTGPAGARNFGSLHARGKFLAFTDDDCQVEPGWLRELALASTKTPDRIIGGRTLNALPQNPYSETSQTIIDVVYSHFNPDPSDARFFASNNFAVPAARFREMKGFDETFITSEDREICARWRAHGWGLGYAPEAVVYHSHGLNLRSLWQQHFAYGRGARRYHHARALNGDGRFRPDMNFYRNLCRATLLPERKIRGVQLTALLLWAQLANASGFVYDALKK